MSDVHSAAIRSKNMRAIKNKDTKPEIIIRQALHARGLRFRLHVKTLPGTPDIVLPKFKTVVFVNGCFWHGHRCHLSKTPKTRTEFWLSKISANMSRDVLIYKKLSDAGWRIAVIWECGIKGCGNQKLNALISEFVEWLNDPKSLGFELP
ncbi:very short patch repair endonuclease [Solimicrobium silvestre]|uniref:Very short patch repair endonuclease n=1 Tax=Solimicrobium silvestre TaxID=2099400 RepID=A0A2S9H366_9BURK|nr:DNA mismatch endonuclease Vsr [Solimicrobium silvestre]PRC94397.1 vsr: DNA mismatch endonuclease Vsr [Solimicrobium silvestre]